MRERKDDLSGTSMQEHNRQTIPSCGISVSAERFPPALLFVIALLCGCAQPEQVHFITGSGDAGKYILEKASAYARRPIAVTDLPELNEAWSYVEDQFGTVVRISKNDYGKVKDLLRHIFGTPNFGPSETMDGGEVGVYRLTEKGGAIQYTRDTDGTRVVIVRPPPFGNE